MLRVGEPQSAFEFTPELLPLVAFGERAKLLHIIRRRGCCSCHSSASSARRVACIIHAQTYNTDLAQDLARITTTTRGPDRQRTPPRSPAQIDHRASSIDHVGHAVCNCAHKMTKRSTFHMMEIEIVLPARIDCSIPSTWCSTASSMLQSIRECLVYAIPCPVPQT